MIRTDEDQARGGGVAIYLTCNIEPRQAYLYASVAGGPFKPEQARAFTRRILESCAEHRLSKVLLDCRGVQGPISTIDRFEYSKALAEDYLAWAAKAAGPVEFVYLCSEPILEVSRFGETVAANRGVRIKVTTDHDQAMGWLGS